MALEDEMTMDEVTAPVVDEATMDEQVASFDLAAWVEGLTPVRGSVTVYGDMSGNAEIGILDSRIKEARLAGAKPEMILALNEAKRQCAARVAETALDVIFEARSTDWVNRQIREGKKAGLKGAVLERTIMCEQIVEPAGITPDLLEQIAAVDGGQYALLKVGWKNVNSEAGTELPFCRGFWSCHSGRRFGM